MERHESVDMENRPSGLPNFGTDANPQNVKKRDYFMFADDVGSSEKIITVCYLRCIEDEKYSPISKRQDVSPHAPNPISSYKLTFSAGDELADNRFRFEYKYLCAGNEYDIGADENGVSFTKSDFEHFLMKIRVKIIAESGSVIPEENKLFHIKAIVTKPMPEGDPIHDERRMDLTYSPYQGWTLTKKGKLMQGKKGWLIDENKYYILKDGRRVTKAEAEKPVNNGLRFGNEDITNGLDDIFGKLTLFTLILKSEYTILESLRSDILPSLPVVVFHAFQISICYIGTDVTYASNCRFWRIGIDETDIPIVVTQIGLFGPNKNRIVIAGPHGDERNAIFAILETQKNFIVNGFPSENLILFFIPAVSPTMFFADVRGILNQFWQTPMSPPFKLDKVKATIPELHEKIKYKERYALQYNQVNQRNPNIGVDTNRDYYFSFPSNQCFANFIQTLTSVDIQRGIGSNDGSCTVFMIHGYDSTKAPNKTSTQGSVYGQYKVANNIGTITKEIKRYIDYITQSLFGYINAKSGERNSNKSYFYKEKDNMSEFEGEWIRHLYGEKGESGILAFDIELGETYRQGTRDNDYESKKVGNTDLPFFNDSNGFFVEKKFRISEEGIGNDDREKKYEYITTSFFEFLRNFYEIKRKIDNES
jgi:hypothetical protein